MKPLLHVLAALVLVFTGIGIGLSVRFAPASPAAAQGTCRTFTETGKTVCGKFLQYWDSHGGLAQQGYPLSGEFAEVNDLDGKQYTVQYFERAVFEAHPENQPPYDVLLSQLGTFQFKKKYPGGDPSLATPATPTAPATLGTPVLPALTPTSTSVSVPTATSDEPPRIPVADFKALYDDPAKRPLILDVRDPELYAEGHIKGAISFPEADVDARVGELPKDKLIVAYCQ